MGRTRRIPEWRKNLQGVGSDTDNFSCFYCGCHDRERHLFMFFDKLDFWSKLSNTKILHFAPERMFSEKIESCQPSQYIKADFYPAGMDIKKIDVTAIPYKDQSFDMVICNHVLEHVQDYKKALNEIYRVLTDRGIAILQTPMLRLLVNNFEDPGINTDALREIYYGQRDHVRYFSEKQFFKSLADAGFELQIVKHNDLFSEDDAKYFGVNKNEDLIRVTRHG